jgi:hypothetical protein
MSLEREKSPEVSKLRWFSISIEKAGGRSKRKKLFDWHAQEQTWETQKLQRAKVLT